MSPSAVPAAAVTDVSARCTVLLAVGEAATFGRSSASTELTFRLHDSRSLSRRAGSVEVVETGRLLVRSTQRDDCGGVSVLAPSGAPVATLAHGSEFVCRLPEFRVRVRVDGLGHFDLHVTQELGPDLPAEGTTTDPDRTFTIPWETAEVLDPAAQQRWQTALAIACTLTVHGPPHRPATDAWDGQIPTAAMVLRWTNAYLGSAFGGHWLSDRWDQGLQALGMPRTSAGADKLPALVREVLASGRASPNLLAAVLDRLRELPR